MSASGSAADRQSMRESLDLVMYQRIREEGIARSHVMEYASALMDGIGPRLTGSPNMRRANEWTRDQFAAMGCANAHLEDWGEFGVGWQQLNTAIRMTAPDFAVFIAQALPWSPSTKGAVQAAAASIDIDKEEDLAQYRGKLAGKIVLVGKPRDAKPVDEGIFARLDEKKLAELDQHSTRKPKKLMEQIKPFLDGIELRRKAGEFLASEHAAAAIFPSRDGDQNGGSGGTIFDDYDTGLFAYQREHTYPVPVAVMAIENYGRIHRLLKAHVPVSLEMNVDVRITGDHEHGYNTVAEIPGTDPRLKNEVVMLGAHLDSWIAGTGATDNGAGSVAAMEVMRILNALQVKPGRTIRVALWSGEEQGMYGSRGYVSQHFGGFPRSTAPDQMQLPEFFRKPAGPMQLEPDQRLVSVYFNVDNGGGRIRGVHLQENAGVRPVFEQWIQPLHDLGVTTLSMSNTGGTDHETLDEVGIPAFQFIQDPLDYFSRTHHSNMDVYEELRAEDMAQIATVEAIFVYNAAMRDQMLPRKPVIHPELLEKQSAALKGIMPGAVEAEEKSAAEKLKAPESKDGSQPH